MRLHKGHYRYWCRYSSDTSFHGTIVTRNCGQLLPRNPLHLYNVPSIRILLISGIPATTCPSFMHGRCLSDFMFCFLTYSIRPLTGPSPGDIRLPRFTDKEMIEISVSLWRYIQMSAHYFGPATIDTVQAIYTSPHSRDVKPNPTHSPSFIKQIVYTPD